MRLNRFLTLGIFWLAILGADLLGVFGVLTMDFDDGLRRAFRSDTPEYVAYERYVEDFETGEANLLALFEAPDFADPEALSAVREFLLEVQFVGGVAAAISPFAFEYPDATPRAFVIPNSLPPPSEMASLLDDARATVPGFGGFLSEDRTALLVALPLSDAGAIGDRRALHREIERLVDAATRTGAVTGTATGLPLIQDGIVASLLNDTLLMIVTGVVIATAIGISCLRSVTLAFSTTFSAGTALLWVLGVLGLVGVGINVITIALPSLILVLSAADGIHLVLEVERQHKARAQHPIRAAVRRILPAALLAAVSTSAAFMSLMLSPSELVWELGLAGAFGTLLGTAAVFLVLPLLLWTYAETVGLDRIFRPDAPQVARWTRGGALVDLAGRAPRLVGRLSLIALAFALAGYSLQEHRYSMFESVGDNDPRLIAMREIEARLQPLGALQYLHPPTGQEDILAIEAALAEAVAPAQLDRLAAAGGESFLPGVLADGVQSPTTGWYRLTVRIPYVDAATTRAEIERIDAAIAADPALAAIEGPTGLIAVSSSISEEMLSAFARCFIVAIGASVVAIGIWLRDWRLAIVALVPNVMPVAFAGAWLAVSGAGLQFNTGIALTIAFGLAIDDTVHVLNRLRLMAQDTPSGRLAPDTATILAATKEAAPALVITSAVLSLGLVGAFFAELSTVAEFGQVSIAVFLMALVADLLCLPALLILSRRWRMGDARA